MVSVIANSSMHSSYINNTNALSSRPELDILFHILNMQQKSNQIQ